MKNNILLKTVVACCLVLGGSILEARMSSAGRGYERKSKTVDYRDKEALLKRSPRQNLACSVASPFACVELDEIRQCCCQLRSLIIEEFSLLASLIESADCCSYLASLIESADCCSYLASLIETADCCSYLASLIESADCCSYLASLIETADCCSYLASLIETADCCSYLASLIESADCCSYLASLIETADCCSYLASLIETADCCSYLASLIESTDCCSYLASLIEKADCCSHLSSLIEATDCCSLIVEINDVVGSKTDLGITSVPGVSPFTTLDAINNTDLTVIGWLKSIMAQLVGV